MGWTSSPSTPSPYGSWESSQATGAWPLLLPGGEDPVINTRTLDPADLDQQRVLPETALADLDQGHYRGPPPP